MSLLPATPPVTAGVAASPDYRPRTAPGQTTILQDSTIPARQAAMTPDGKPKERQPRQRQAPPEAELPPGSMYAVAVVAGALPPKPASREELLLRLGGAKVPDDTAVRLPNHLV